jgi:hypothetical protein
MGEIYESKIAEYSWEKDGRIKWNKVKIENKE